MTSVFAKQSTESRVSILESQRLWLALIIVLGATLRLYRLDFQSLWYDEGLQHYVATQNSIGDLFRQTRSFHPPASFIVNHLFLLLGESDFLLRLPSALFGIASLPVVYILARDLTSKESAVFAVFVLAISPFHVWYSQDGRMYMQLMFLSLLSSVLFIQALKRSGVRWWISYTLVAAAGMYTHVFMVWCLIAQFVWMLIYYRDRLRAHLTAGATVFLLFLPWALLLPWIHRFVRGVSATAMGSGAPAGPRAAFRAGFSWESIPYTFFAYSSGFSIGPTVRELHENRSLAFILQFAPEILLVVVIFGGLLLVGLPGLYRRYHRKSMTFCLVGLCVPILGAFLYALAPRATYNVRYAITAFPYFCIFLGVGLTLVFQNNRAAGGALLLGVLAISSTSLANYFFNPRYAKEDVRSAVVSWRSVSNGEPLLSYRADNVVRVYLRGSEKERHSRLTEDVISDINLLLSKTEAPSVYILLGRDWKKLKEKAIRTAYVIDHEQSYPGVILLRITNSRAGHNTTGAL
jgi:uncharacterized membrane protein